MRVIQKIHQTNKPPNKGGYMLSNIIRENLNNARKNGNTLAKEAFSAVLAKIETVEKSGKYPLPLTDSIVENAIIKQVNEYKETLSFYKEGTEGYNEYSNKISVLSPLLPQEMSEEEVLKVIREEAAECQIRGKLIGSTIKRIGNKFDKSKIASLVDRVLSEK